MSPVSTVAVAGITGKLGQLATKSLLEMSPQIKIRGFCRDKSKVDSPLALTHESQSWKGPVMTCLLRVKPFGARTSSSVATWDQMG